MASNWATNCEMRINGICRVPSVYRRAVAVQQMLFDTIHDVDLHRNNRRSADLPVWLLCLALSLFQPCSSSRSLSICHSLCLSLFFSVCIYIHACIYIFLSPSCLHAQPLDCLDSTLQPRLLGGRLSLNGLEGGGSGEAVLEMGQRRTCQLWFIKCSSIPDCW